MKTIETTDLYFATFLRVKNIKMLRIEWSDSGKGVFVFEAAPDLLREWGEGQPMVRVKEFISHLLNLKDELFLSKRRWERDKER